VSSSSTRVFFATDIHGSTKCFKKFLNAGQFYEADVLILGGDVTGKVLVPIVAEARNRFFVYEDGRKTRLRSDEDVLAFEARAADGGSYTYRCTDDEFQELAANSHRQDSLFTDLIRRRVRAWVELADSRLAGKSVRVFFNAGNDDIIAIDEILDSSRTLCRPEGQVVDIDSHTTMISTGYANETPFLCPRDVPENLLGEMIERMLAQVSDVSRCVFNFHCPPYKSQLDDAPKLDAELRPRMTAFGIEHAPAGSTAVRRAIEDYQPLLGLHGHIHESRGAIHIGRTLCINPGSEYHEGILRGALIDIERGVMRNYTFTSG